MSAGGIAKLPVLPGLERLTIFLENDDKSRNAARACGLRWREAGRDIIVVNSLQGSDLNDAIRAGLGR